MSLARFAELAGAYGADLDRWPEPQRFAALEPAGRSADARALLADAHEVDAALASLGRPPAPSAALRARIAALEPGNTPPLPRPAGIAGPFGRAAVFAMAAAAGIVLGVYLAPPGAGDAGLGLVEASLIAGDAPSIVVGDLLELD